MESQINRSISKITSAPAILDVSELIEGIDPLTKFALEEMDPLSQMVAEMVIVLIFLMQ